MRVFYVKIVKNLWADGDGLCPHLFYQNLSAPLIATAFFRFVQNEQGVLHAKNAANCDPSNFSIVLRYSGGFAVQLKHFSLQRGIFN